MRALPMACLFLVGCGGPPPVAPVAQGQGPARVLAVARDLEKGQKTKQAVAAYRQVVLHYPDTPEARAAARRISEVQGAAIRNAATRRVGARRSR